MTEKLKSLLHLRKIYYVLLVGIIGIAFFTITSYVVIDRYGKYVFNVNELPENKKANIAIVFGGGISDQQPLPLLENRLNKAKELLDSSIVDKILLSGDNRFLDYNEPSAMFDYLINKGVEVSKLEVDFAGRSTYETCERAKKVFKVEQAILVSESSHLPRAIYLCRHFSIDAIGVYSDGDSSSIGSQNHGLREILARNKAIINIYLYGEKTVLGSPVDDTTLKQGVENP